MTDNEFMFSRLQKLQERDSSALSDSFVTSLQAIDNPDAFLGSRMLNISNNAYNNGKIDGETFKSHVNKYGSYLGNDAKNQIFAEVDNQEKELPKLLYKQATSQYLPGDMFDTEELLPENAEPEIALRSSQSWEESGEIAELSSHLVSYDHATQNLGAGTTQKEVDEATTDLLEYMKGVYGDNFRPEEVGEDWVKLARERLQRLKALYDADSNKRDYLQNGMPLKKEYDAYNSLSDEDKLLVSQYIRSVSAYLDEAGKTITDVESIWDIPDFFKNNPWNSDSYARMEEIKGQLEERIKNGELDFNDYLTGFVNRIVNLYGGIEYQEAINTLTERNPVAANIANIITKPFYALAGVGGAVAQNISNLATGENLPVDPNSTTQLLGGTSTMIQGKTSEMIQNAVPGWGGEALNFVYGVGTSTIDSTVAALANAVVPGSGLAIIGTEAAASAIYDASKRGASAGQALFSGILAGCAEAAFEKLPMDNVLKTAKAAPGSLKGVLLQALKGAGINAPQEALTTVANTLGDILIMQDKSQYEQAVQDYMDEDGLTREEAEKKAAVDIVKQVAVDAFAGALQGGGMTAGSSFIGHLNIANTGKQIIATPNGIETLLGAAEQGDAAVRKAADAVRQNPSAGNVGNLAAALQEYTKQPVGNVLAYPSQVKAMHNGEFTPPVSTASAASATAGRAANATPPMVNTTPPENMAAEAANTDGTDGADTFPASAAAAQSEALSGPVQQVAGIISRPNVTASQADRIVKSPQLSSAFTQLTGKALDGLTNAEKRQTVRDSAGYVVPDVQSAEVSGVAEPSVLQEDSGTGSGLVYDDYVNNSLEPAAANQIDRVAKLLGTRVRFVDSVRGGTANAQIRGREILVERNNPNPVRFLLGHEWTHLMQESAPQAYMSFRNAIASELQGEARALLDLYRQQGEILSTEAALDEAAANMAGRMLEDGRLLDEFIERHRDNKSLLRRMWEAVKRLVHKLTGAERRMAQTAEGKLAAALDETVESAVNENAAQTSGDVRYSIDPYFASDVQEWDSEGRPAGETFVLGSTGDTLQGLGAIESDIYMNGDKISQILKDHPEMTLDEIKRIPEILEDPVFILKSRNNVRQNSRLIIFGSIKAQDGRPIMCVIDLRPTENGLLLDNMQKVSSAYTKDNNPQGFISGSEILYADEKRTIPLLRTIGFQMPITLQHHGSIGSITYSGPKVNISGEPFSSVVKLGNNDNNSNAQADTRPDEKSSARFSIKYDQDNTPYVVVENDILRNVPKSQWIDTVKENLARKFPDGVHVGNNIIKINSQTRREMTYSEYTKWLSRNDRNAYADKFRSSEYADEIILASRDYINEGLKHARKDNIRDFARGNVLLQVGGKDYTADVIVGTTRSGEMLLYDIVNLQRTTINEKSRHAVQSDQKGDRRSGMPTTHSISQSGEKSNTQNSLKGSEDARSVSELERENRELRKRLEHFKEQLHRSNGITTDKEAVQKTARQVIREYNADLATDDIAGDLQSLYDFMASGKDGENELSYEAARERSNAIARRIVENAVVTDDSTYRQYSDLRGYLRSNKLIISPEDSRNIPDFNNFRKSNFGRMNIGTKGEANIDQVYTELSTLYPEFFDGQRDTTPADQLQRIAEVAGEIYDTSPNNPSSQYMDEAVTGVSNDIMERFFDLPQTAPTFADRKAKQLQDLRRQNRQRTKEAVKKERDRQEKRINRLKTQYRARTAEARERQDAREMRARIIRHTNQLSKKLLRPSDKQHIPESLRTAVASLLESVNLESAYSVDPETGKRVKDGSGTPTKRTEAARELRLAYSQILKDGTGDTMIIDPDLMDNLDEMASMKDTPLMAMNAEQLQTVWATVKAVEASIQNANRVLGESRYKAISEIAEGIRDDNAGRKDRGNYRAPIDAVDKLTRIDMLEPYSFLHQLGPTGDALWEMQRNAQDRYIRRIAELERDTVEILGDTDIQSLMKQTHSFDIRGQKLTLTTPQIMELLELTKRPQAQEHILVGGVRPEAVRTGAGLRESRPSEAVRLTPDDIARITGVLTDEQVKLADDLQAYLSNTVSEWGNETSMEVYGYRKFTDPHYYPIRVDRNQVQRDVSNEAQAATIAGRGFTKTTTPNANNAVMLQSIFDTFYSHAKDMASYSGWVTAMENLRRIRNFNFRDADGNRTGSVQAVLEKVFGKEGPAYLDKLMDDINRGGGDADVGFTERFASNYKAASVGANLRVMAQQPTSFVRAAAMINPKYLTQGIFNRVNWDLVKEYAPIAQWKDWGFFDISTGRQMRDIILHTDSRLEKLKQLSMRGAGFMDRQTWKSLWRAVELETRDTHPDLRPGTKEFYQAVGERFSRVIDRTQVVDGVLQRSQIMRSKNWLNRTASSFMSEPTKIYNMALNAAYDVRHAPTKAARRAAFGALGRTSFALLASFVANSVAQSLVDAMRDDDDEKNYWDKFLAAFLGFSGDEESFMDYFGSFWSGNLEASMNPLEYIPYVKDALSLLKGYDVSRMDMEPIAKLITAGQNLFSGKYSVAGSVSNFVAEASRVFGLSPANLIRDVKGIFNTITDATHAYVAQYYIDKFFLDLGYEGNASELKGLLEKAKENDMGDYEIIYADAWENGYLGAQKVFETEAPDSVTQNKITYDLTDEQQEEYEDIVSEATTKYLSDLEKRSAYKKMDYEEKESVAESLYDYATALAKAEVVPEYELEQSKALMERLEDAGVSAADQVLIKKTADTDGNGRLTNDEYEEAVNNSWLQEWAKELMLAVYKANNKQDKEKREKAVDRAFEQHSR